MLGRLLLSASILLTLSACGDPPSAACEVGTEGQRIEDRIAALARGPDEAERAGRALIEVGPRRSRR